MKSVPEVPLLDVAEGIFDGPHATPPESLDGPIFLRLDNITPEGRLDLTDLRFINQADFTRWTRRVTPLPGDVVFSYEATLHRYVVIPDGFHGCLGRRLALVRPNRNRIEPRYLHYYFLSPRWRAVAGSAVINGATVDRISLTLVRNLPVRLPSLQHQRRIVDVLSAYDDLIENNRRRMALLEESARLLYQEWFVRLRFPGHEHVRVIDGLPEGWARIALGDLCHIRRGASPRPIQAFMGGTVPWFKIGDATNSSSMYVFSTAEHVTEEGAKKSVLLGPGELIISNSATCGLPYFTGVTGCIHDGWLLLTPSSFASREILYLCLKTKREELVNSVSDGSTQKNLNTDAASRLPLVFPKSDSLMREFDTHVQPIFNQINTLARCNDSARVARDHLLPRLMSGEVAV